MTGRPLLGRVAFVTGAGRGIGREVARWLAEAGADVAVAARTTSELDEVARELRVDHGVRVTVHTVDVADPAALAAVVTEAAARLGRLDVAVANAGVLGPVGPLGETDADRWLNTLRVNVGGAANLVRSAVPHMVTAGGGRILTVSGAGLGGPQLPSRVSAYVASKAAVVGLTEALAAELPPGVTINAVAPGAIPTGFMDEVLACGPEVAGAALHATVVATKAPNLSPLRRLVLFLVSDAAAHLSGRCLSARWDDPAMLAGLTEPELTGSRLRLRRIDQELYCERTSGAA